MIPVKASFQLLGGLALVSTSQHTFHVPQVGSTLKTFFCVFFWGGHCEGRENQAFPQYHLNCGMHILSSRQIYHQPQGAQVVILLTNRLFLEHQFGWCFFCVKRVGLKVPNMCHGGAEIGLMYILCKVMCNVSYLFIVFSFLSCKVLVP